MTKQIPLTQGKFALVDDEDFDYLNQWKWHAKKDHRTAYALRKIWSPTKENKRRQLDVFMHRAITNAPVGMFVDHINGDGLDNRRANLRICTNKENSRNVKWNIKNTSGYKGVTWAPTEQRFHAQIRVNKKTVTIGRFTDPVKAAHAYDEAAKKYHGEFASLNFPEVQS